MQDLYDVKFRIFQRVTKKDMGKWKGNPYHKVVHSHRVSL